MPCFGSQQAWDDDDDDGTPLLLATATVEASSCDGNKNGAMELESHAGSPLAVNLNCNAGAAKSPALC